MVAVDHLSAGVRWRGTSEAKSIFKHSSTLKCCCLLLSLHPRSDATNLSALSSGLLLLTLCRPLLRSSVKSLFTHHRRATRLDPPPSALCLHPPERRGERMTAGRTSTIIKEQKTMLTYCLYLSGGLTKKNTESFPDSWWRIWTPSNGKTANNLGSSLDRRMTEFFFLPPHRILLLLHYL